MSSRGSSAWLLQRVTGALLFITLGTHFYLYHYFMGPGMWGFDSIGFGATDWATLKAMMDSNPEMAKYYKLAYLFRAPMWKVFDVTLISLGTYHGFYGIKAIIDDWVTHDRWRFIANWIVYICGVILWVMGIVAVISFNPELF
jgi:succinate dehydrogenase hydrophobic anchor subunit